MADATIWRRAFELSQVAEERFGLRVKEIIPMMAQKSRELAYCHFPENVIELRVHVNNRPREPLRTSTIEQSLAHELTHIWMVKDGLSRHHHSRAFYRRYRAIRKLWKEEGWL